MRRLYVLFAIGVIVLILLITSLLIFFEKEKHRSIFYTVSINGKYAGYIKTDRYRTEDKVIYKSTGFRPKQLHGKFIHEKIVFYKKGFQLEKYSIESKNSGRTPDSMQIRDGGKVFDFLAKKNSRWVSVSNIPYAKDISIFDELSISSYMTFVDKYNFSKGGAQTFNALYVTDELLPPGRGRLVLKSIRDEYINIERKKIKTEVIVVKQRTLPEIYLWISKNDRAIVRLESKRLALLMQKVSFPQKLRVLDYAKRDIQLEYQDVLFPSDDIALSGTVVVPKKKGEFPAVLLVAGDGSFDRRSAGLYADIADYLGRSGYVSLQYDKRGIGKSQGDNSAVSIEDEVKDMENALYFLSNHKKTEKNNIFIIAHAEASSYLPLIRYDRHPARGIVCAAPKSPAFGAELESESVLSVVKKMGERDKKYKETLDRMKRQTLNILNDAKKDYVFVQGKHLFAKRMRELLKYEPTEGFKKLAPPLLIIYGKKDIYISQRYISEIENAVGENPAGEVKDVFFRNLGHFLGKRVDEGNSIIHYKVNIEALETIAGWLNSKREADLTNE